jgi:hypothetical protein
MKRLYTYNLFTTTVSDVMAVIRRMKKAGYQEVFTCFTTTRNGKTYVGLRITLLVV